MANKRNKHKPHQNREKFVKRKKITQKDVTDQDLVVDENVSLSRLLPLVMLRFIIPRGGALTNTKYLSMPVSGASIEVHMTLWHLSQSTFTHVNQHTVHYTN